jgi:hypothetical protein
MQQKFSWSRGRDLTGWRNRKVFWWDPYGTDDIFPNVAELHKVLTGKTEQLA